MKHWIAWLAVACTCVLSPAPRAVADTASPQPAKPVPKPTRAKTPSDGQIRQILIEESIAAYPGNCPCPYSTMRNGRSCGRRSAYSREGGASPLCYAKDVTTEMVRAYREANPSE